MQQMTRVAQLCGGAADGLIQSLSGLAIVGALNGFQRSIQYPGLPLGEFKQAGAFIQ